jgi:hypothetical protein
MSETLKARIVHVKRELGAGGYFYASSPDIKGLLVIEPTLAELDEAIPKAIADLYAVSGHPVVVTDVEENDADFRSWVMVPAEIAERAPSDRRPRQ